MAFRRPRAFGPRCRPEVGGPLPPGRDAGLKTGGPLPPRHRADQESAVPALREMFSCQVAGAGVGDQDVVLDADSPVGSQSIDGLPVDGVPPRLRPVPPPGEEHLDEIDPGLHRQDVTRLKGPGAPQHGVRLRGRGPAAVGVGEVASDVVHLDAQEVAEAMREERLAETARDGVFRRQVDDVFVLQDAGQGQMGLVMEFSPGATRRYAFAERLLGTLHGGDQGTKRPSAAPPAKVRVMSEA